MSVGLVLVFGLLATLLSFFYRQNLSTLGLSKFGYGLPFSWYVESQIVYPDSPVVTSMVWVNFFLDLLVWSLIITTLSIIVIRWRRTRV